MGDFVTDLVEHWARDADLARKSAGPYPRSEVHRVSESVSVAFLDIPEMHTDPQFDASPSRPRISFPHATLDVNRALSGMQRAAELDQETVTR